MISFKRFLIESAVSRMLSEKGEWESEPEYRFSNRNYEIEQAWQSFKRDMEKEIGDKIDLPKTKPFQAPVFEVPEEEYAFVSILADKSGDLESVEELNNLIQYALNRIHTPDIAIALIQNVLSNNTHLQSLPGYEDVIEDMMSSIKHKVEPK